MRASRGYASTPIGIPEPPARPSGGGGRLAGVRVLLIDHDPALRESFHSALAGYGRVDVMLNNAAQPGKDLHVWEQNLPAIRLYETLGFELQHRELYFRLPL